ncbi:RHS repeat-associated core domain-containing protein [Nonomuraea sp. NPDC047529]|uniref:RHS repeat-associated core domain-containing protein n=1 Tax=Nonomuraea sp. NPDC047529 TaxID=3155623 RepID=UPI003407CDBE
MLPAFLGYSTMPALAEVSPVRLPLPASPSDGASTHAPVQQTGTAKDLPHLVDTAATRARAKAGREGAGDDGRVPGALPVDVPHMMKQPDVAGLKTPPPPPGNPAGKGEDAAGGSAGPQGPAFGRAATITRGAGRTAAARAAAEPVVDSWWAYPVMESESSTWTFPTVTPTFEGQINDPAGRYGSLVVEVEHDPSVPAQGSGLIWSATGTPTSASTSFSSVAMPAGKVQDGWLVRMRVRAVTTGGSPVAGPWSGWQAGKVETHKPFVESWWAGPLMEGESSDWTFSSVTPTFEGRIADPAGRYGSLVVEVEHDPSVPAQGSGLIWSGTGPVTSATSSYSAVSMPAGKMRDGWRVRIRVRAVIPGATPVTGAWSAWQAGKVDTHKPLVESWWAGPLMEGESSDWTFSNLTPQFEGRITDAESRYGSLVVEVEHDPSAAGQGSGLIWSGTGTVTSATSAYSSVTVPAGKLKDGWHVRMRVRAVIPGATPVTGPWSGWQAGKVDTHKPLVESWWAGPLMEGEASTWAFSSLTPRFEGRITDAESRNGSLVVEVEHDPSVPAQGSGQIWSGTGTVTSSSSPYSAVTVPAGKLQDGWHVRMRVRSVTSGSSPVTGPWSAWRTGRVDTTKPVVESWWAGPLMEGEASTWTFSSLTPQFEGRVTDPSGRYGALAVEVEHDPSVPAQGSGQIWAATGSVTSATSAYSTATVPAGKLRDGWLVRMRVRAVIPGTTPITGPWSEWRLGRVDTTKPIVESWWGSPASESTLWSFSLATPTFEGRITDPSDRYGALAVEVEHDPSVSAQGSGLIWSGTGPVTSSSSAYSAVTVPAGKLQDGWFVRMRVRAVIPGTTPITGPWSEWQFGMIEVGRPAGAGLGAMPATQGTGTWTLSSLTPWLYMKVTTSNGAASSLGTEIEHDPAVPAQGTGLIYAGKDTTSYPSGSNVWLQVPAGKLRDGWRVRWRVRGVPTSGTAGAWSAWQYAGVDLKKPSAAAPGMTPGTSGAGQWTLPSLTPSVYATVTDPESRASFLGVEIEHDPSAPAQGSGLIYSGRGSASSASGRTAWLQVPAGKLRDGWRVRWRVRGETTTGVAGPWIEWQTARVDLTKPSAEAPGLDPATRGTASWTTQSLTPSVYAKVTDAENRAMNLGVEIEHDPAVPEQGKGSIYAATGTTPAASGREAWLSVPSDKLRDGWLVRWRVRAVTTSGVGGPWSEWQAAKINALPFETFSPANNTRVGTLTPTLSAHARPADPATEVTYWFQVCAGKQPTWSWCETSPDWGKSGAWTVPGDKLKWGQTYWWQAKAMGGGTTVTSSWRAFVPVPEQGSINASLGEGSDGLAFDHSTGNYTTAAIDASVTVVGPPLSVARTYNSLDLRPDSAFGVGWSTRWDMRVEPEPKTSTVLITYPGGEQHRFAVRKGETPRTPAEATYASPPGVFATLADVTGGGWRLMDKSATSYWFDAAGRLTKVTDNRNHTQELTYGADGKLAKATATGGRSLTFTWTGAHVTAVSTDPVGGAPLTWTYAYDGDKLVKVCPPSTTTACSVYSYGDASRYRSAVLDTGPEGYWRLNETGTANGTKIDSATPWQPEPGEEAKLTGTTPDVVAAVPGALTGSPDTAMRFKGTATSSYVALPQSAVNGQGGNLAVEAWFRTTGSGTILGYQNSTDTPSAFTPVLYVGTDGKLRGQFYTKAATPITSAVSVKDGNWHHVVLSGAEDTQTLFLDGQAVGTLAGEIEHYNQYETRIGSGYGSSAWPATTGTTAVFPFAGDIDEVAVYGKPLGAQVVKTHYAARSPQPQLVKSVTAAGRTEAENVYAADGGRLTQHTDANGGTWKLSAPVYSRETNVLVFATTTVTDPHDKTLTLVDDALRGNRPISKADQLGQTSRFTYDVGGYPAKIFDPNGNVVETAFDSRGNLLSKKTCRTATNCATEYHGYYLNIDNPFDPRNDLENARRDARSSAPADETYQTSWVFNSFGEQIKQTIPATSDFPQGRTTVKTYSDGTEPAEGGGLTPAGLLKSAKDHKGNETTYTYTAAGDLAVQTSPGGLAKKYEHDALGRAVTVSEISQAFPDGVKTNVVYDALGRVTSRTGTGVKNVVTGVTHTSLWTGTYDADGLPLTESLADVTGGDRTRATAYTYDVYGRVETATGPEGGVQRFAYDHKGQKISFTDERGTTFAYGYTLRGEWATTTLKGWTGSPVTPQQAADLVMTSNAYDPAGRMASQTDALGRTTAYTYYDDNMPAEKIAKNVRLNGSTAPRDVVLESRTYDAAGNLTSQTSDGGTLQVDATFDAAGRLVSQTVDPARLNRVTAVTYDANDNVTKISMTAAGSGRTEVSEYAYNEANRPIRQVVHNGGQDLVTSFTVDDRGLVTSTTDPRGNAPGADPAAFTTTLSYDEAGQVAQVQLPSITIERAGAPTATMRPSAKMGYNTFGDKTHQVDAEGRATTSAFDRAGRVVEQVFPAYTPPGGQPLTPKESAAYDAAGQLITSTDRRGQTTTAVYDGLGRKVQVTAPKAGTAPAGVWTYGFDLLGEALWTVDPTGARSESTYDDLGRQITLTTIERKPSQAAYVTRMEYDDADRVTRTTRPTGDASTRAYDATGALVSETDALGNTTTFAYDLAGRTTRTTDPLGRSSTASYDLAGRKTQIQEVDADGSVLRTRRADYDLAGNPISQTSAEGHTATQVFDGANRLIERQEPISATEKITTSFGYDAVGRPTRSTDGRGNATFTTYNSLGLAESVIEPSTAAHPDVSDRTWTTAYDAAGNPVTSLVPGGVRVDRVFDELNRLTKQSGTGAEVATEDKTFGYDQAGRMVAANGLSFTLNDRGLLLKAAGTGGDLNAFAYDADNRLAQRVDVTGTTSFTWDDADRLTQTVDPVSASSIDYVYDKASRLTSMAYGASGARRSYAYDGLNRLTKDELTTSSGGAIASIEYGYDLDDNLVAKTTSGTAGAGTNTYTYDWANRLTSWTAPDGKKTDYGWDAAGNRTKAGDKTYTYDERNRLTSGDGHSYTYTARGTLAEDSAGIVRLTKFDAFDRLVQDDGVTYHYDGLDRVETRTQGQQTTRHVYDGLSDNLVCVTDAANVVRAAFGRDALGRTLGISDGAGAQLAFSDLRGDLVGAFKADGTSLIDSVAYDPFGEVITRTGNAHALGYQGAYTDPDSGKINMAARWYQPSTGSFVSGDTLSQNADPSVQLNRYAYANDNPLTNIDPDGHKALSKVMGKLAGMVKNMLWNKSGGLSIATSAGGATMKALSCPQGGKKSKDPICKDAAKEYTSCTKENKGKTGKNICQGMKDDYVDCRNERRAGNYKGSAKICGSFADEYVTCRKGSDYESRKSDDVCSGAGREVRRCMFGAENGSRPGYGQGVGGCENVRFDYYSCRADKRGDDPGCSTMSEVVFRCKKHTNVKCDDVDDKFLSCYKRGRGMSANECAFGVNVLFHCRDSVNQKVLSEKGICGKTYNSFLEDCKDLKGLRGSNCTQGESWQDVSYAICENGKGGGVCVTYLSDDDKGTLEKGGELPMVIISSGLDICAAVMGVEQPLVAAGCGVVKAVIDIINGVLKDMQDNAIAAASSGSRSHGEGSGIAVITKTSNCKFSKYATVCKPEYAHIIDTKYAPL